MEDIDLSAIHNKIIAAGVNSLMLTSKLDGLESKLLNEFLRSSFDIIIPCWDHLDDKVKFQIFLIHLDRFKDYMVGKG